MVVDIQGTKKDVEDAIKFCTHRIVDLLDEIEILRNRRIILMQKVKEMVEFEQLELKRALEKQKLE